MKQKKTFLQNNDYVLITAARNEAQFIAQTIESILQQTFLPKKWVIVNDNSTDQTAEIVSRYCNKHDFVTLINKTDAVKRDFASKAFALKEAYDLISQYEFRFIGVLDADITLPDNYYEEILLRFYNDQNLGVAGGVRYDNVNGKWELFKKQPHSVCGAVHFMRRECYNSTGGYPALPYGCEDTYLEVKTRQLGWSVVTFPELSIFHHRKTGHAVLGELKHHYNIAKSFYHIGYDPLYFLITIIYRAYQKPYFLGSIIRIMGFLRAALFEKRSNIIPTDFIDFLRKEQRQRLVKLLVLK